jgi:hypothetical protein
MPKPQRRTKYGKENKQPGRTRNWTLPTILGIALGILGAVGIVELLPQMYVSPQEPTEKSNPFSIPFRLANSGYLSFHVVTIHVYINRIVFMGTNTIGGSVGHLAECDNFSLGRGESQSLIVNLMRGLPTPPSEADIVIVVDYDTILLPKSRRYFRFVGAYVDNWQWLSMHSKEIESEVDRLVNDSIAKGI